jgi:hypothetical protein
LCLWGRRFACHSTFYIRASLPSVPAYPSLTDPSIPPAWWGVLVRGPTPWSARRCPERGFGRPSPAKAEQLLGPCLFAVVLAAYSSWASMGVDFQSDRPRKQADTEAPPTEVRAFAEATQSAELARLHVPLTYCH